MPSYTPSIAHGETNRLWDHHQKEKNPFPVFLTWRFITLTLVGASTIAFGVGHSCRHFLLKAPIPTQAKSAAKTENDEENGTAQFMLPSPILQQGKHLPDFVYSSKIFEDGSSQSSDSLFISRKRQLNKATIPEDENEDEGLQDDLQLSPSGNHLLVDIENVNGAFLDSESLLAEAMLTLVEQSGFTMLSYHCHRLKPVGVSCIGILLKSHISFHTWPISGVIAIDLFTCGSDSLMSYLPVIEELFAIPRARGVTSSSVGLPHVKWAHKTRGFVQDKEIFNPEAVDLGQFVLGWMEYGLKHQIASEQTDFQAVDIYEVISPRFRSLDSYQKSLVEGGGTYESEHPEIFKPDRVVYLDKVTQSRLFGEAAYHEALVHPAMFTHKNPKRVAIVGGGEGATLREVLKHNTVEKVTMIEIDEDFVDMARDHLEEWHDCSNIAGSAQSCFDDDRAEVLFEDAIAWFMDRYGFDGEGRTPEKEENGEEQEKFDVIILDALDPSNAVSFSDSLYNDRSFAYALSNALGSDGILVIQTGETDFDEPPMEFRTDTSDSFFPLHLFNAGFESLLDFEESHGGFNGVWSFLLALKSSRMKARWYANQAEVDLRIQRRSMDTGAGSESPLFRYFDGATMMGYQYPSRRTEMEFCRETKKPLMCDLGHGFDLFTPNVPISELKIGDSQTSASETTKPYAMSDIRQGSYVAIEEGVQTMIVEPKTSSLVQNSMKLNTHVQNLGVFFEQHGVPTMYYGEKTYVVDVGSRGRTKLQCKACDDLGLGFFVAEFATDPNNITAIKFGLAHSPFIERNHITYLTTQPGARKLAQDCKGLGRGG